VQTLDLTGRQGCDDSTLRMRSEGLAGAVHLLNVGSLSRIDQSISSSQNGMIPDQTSVFTLDTV
jgi:hypothetical protein